MEYVGWQKQWDTTLQLGVKLKAGQIYQSIDDIVTLIKSRGTDVTIVLNKNLDNLQQGFGFSDEVKQDVINKFHSATFEVSEHYPQVAELFARDANKASQFMWLKLIAKTLSYNIAYYSEADSIIHFSGGDDAIASYKIYETLEGQQLISKLKVTPRVTEITSVETFNDNIISSKIPNENEVEDMVSMETLPSESKNLVVNMATVEIATALRYDYTIRQVVVAAKEVEMRSSVAYMEPKVDSTNDIIEAKDGKEIEQVIDKTESNIAEIMNYIERKKFFEAVDRNDIESVKEQASKFANATNHYGNSAVFMSIIYGHNAITQALLANGADTSEFNQEQEEMVSLKSIDLGFINIDQEKETAQAAWNTMEMITGTNYVNIIQTLSPLLVSTAFIAVSGLNFMSSISSFNYQEDMIGVIGDYYSAHISNIISIV